MISLFEILILLFFIGAPIVIIAVIVGLIMKHNKNKDDKTFVKTVRSLYIYLILIISLCMIIGSTVWLFSSAIDFLIPEVNGRDWGNMYRNRAIVDMFTASAMLIIAGSLFFYHNKLAKLEKADNKLIKEVKDTKKANIK